MIPIFLNLAQQGALPPPAGFGGGNGPLPVQTSVARKWAAVVNGSTGTYFATFTDDRIAVDTRAGAVTIKLPADPLVGQQVNIVDIAGQLSTNNLLVDAQGLNITTPGGVIVTGATVPFTLNFANLTYEWTVGQFWSLSGFYVDPSTTIPMGMILAASMSIIRQ